RLCSLLMFSSPATATPDLYTLSLHDALPISADQRLGLVVGRDLGARALDAERAEIDPEPVRRTPRLGELPRRGVRRTGSGSISRSEEHTSELQSLAYLVCRLLLEKKKKAQSI